MQVYIKNENGEFVEADNDTVNELFKRRSHAIISERLKEIREKEIAKIRDEVEEDVRNNAVEHLKNELRDEITAEIEGEYKPKLEAETKRADELEVRLRRKTVAAEYGFSADAEEFLGSGNEEEMKAKADKLKSSFSSQMPTPPEKGDAAPKDNKLKEETGLDIKI